MSYTIYKSDGTAILVDDNAIDVAYYNSTGGGGVSAGKGSGVQLIGRNTIDYGAAIAQNFLQMTENFASSSAYFPADNVALQGQLWFNQTSSTLFVRTSNATTGGITNWRQVVTLDGSGNIPGTITESLNLSGGAAGSLPYQSAVDTTSFLPEGLIGQVLTQGASNAPIWSSAPSISGTNFTIGSVPNQALTSHSITLGSTIVQLGATAGTLSGLTTVSATTFNGSLTGTATSLASGVAGSVPYQTASGVTAMLPPGSDTQVLTMSGGVPVWGTGGGGGGGGGTYTSGPGINVDNTLNTITNTGVISATGSTNIAVSSGAGNVTFSLVGNVPKATNLAGGAAGYVPYQSTAGTTTYLAPATDGQVMTLSGGVPVWATPSAGGVTSITAGANISLSGSTGAVTVAVTGTVPSATTATTATTASNANALGGQGIGYFQPALGFTPVQQGGGTGQLTNKIYIGWASPGILNLQVDVTNFGNTWPIDISGTATNATQLGGVAASSFTPWGTTWTLPARAMNTWYQNTTGKTIYVLISLRCNGDQTGANLLIGSSAGSYFTACVGTTKGADIFVLPAPVPDGLYYYCQNNGTVPGIVQWAELR